MKKNYSEEVIEAFILGRNKNDIAQRSGLSLKTVYRYMRDPDFQEILNERKTEYVRASVNKMQSVMSECVDVLLEIIRDEETPSPTKVNAISTMFNQCREWTVTADILERLKAIEESQKNR